MNSFYQMGGGADDLTLVVNTANPSVQALLTAAEEAKTTVVMQLYYLALLSYRQLTPDENAEFMQSNAKLLETFFKK